MSLSPNVAAWLWSNGLAVVPIVLLVAAIVRWLPTKASTRHALWLVVLLWFMAPPTLPAPPVRELSDKVVGAVGRVWPSPAGRSAAPMDEAMVSAQPRRDEPCLPAPWPCPNADEAALPQYVDVPAPPPESEPVWEPCESSGAEPTGSSGFAGRTESLTSRYRAYAAVVEVVWETLHDKIEAAFAPWVDACRFARIERRVPAAIEAASEKASATESSNEPPAAAKHVLGIPLEWRTWLDSLATLRTAALQLQPIPLTLWLGGIGVLVLCRAVGAIRLLRLVRTAVPAGPRIRRVVREAAAEMRLRRVPETLLVEEAVSPMVCGGRCPRLILPESLWGQLDQRGRQAVIFHELAHLKRGDHWIRRLGALVCAAFWWHPLAWWVSRRVSEEAELCCDAWVTWLLPRDRRAYAQALVHTKAFLSQQPSRTPPTAIGVLSGRARQLARRLTMIMTERSRPRLSLSGAVLVAALVAIGWTNLPIWACDPKAEAAVLDSEAPDDTAPPAEVLVLPRSPHAASTVTPAVPVAPGTPRASRAPRAWVTPPATPRPLAVVPGVPWAPIAGGLIPAVSNNDDDDDRDDLERRLRALERNLERLTAALEHMQGGHGQPAPSPRAASAPRAMAIPRNSAGPDTVRVYRLPDDKLKSLVELMSREDVPVRVRDAGDGIEVHASEGGQQVFAAFVDMIGDAPQWRSYHLENGKRDALLALMSRDDVPIYVAGEDDGLRIQATPRQHEYFAAFIEMIGGKAGDPSHQDKVKAELDAVKKAKEQHKSKNKADKHSLRLRQEMQALDELKELEKVNVDSARKAIEQAVKAERLAVHSGQMGHLRAERLRAEALRRAADQVREDADRVRAEADTIRERTESSGGEAAEELEAQADEIEQRAEEMEAQAEALEAEVEAAEE